MRPPPGPGGLPPWPGPVGLFGSLCNAISSCAYFLCCCWLIQDCFGTSPPDPPALTAVPPAPAPPLPAPFPGPPAPPGPPNWAPAPPGPLGWAPGPPGPLGPPIGPPGAPLEGPFGPPGDGPGSRPF